ncbi:MAG: translation initiation factor IF-2 N-terminal domain-containing protein [Planctomycetota bacterium]|nr:translation initiation factor IF-2 N-terminal domain-containing protein [Planctomycetota bacterium]
MSSSKKNPDSTSGSEPAPRAATRAPSDALTGSGASRKKATAKKATAKKATTKKATTKKATTKKATTKKAAARKVATKKAATKKTTTKKATAKKATTKKAATKKAATKKAATKKAATKKATTKKAASKKTASKKTASKKTASKKTASKKTASKKTTPKKTTAKKAAAKKAATKKTAEEKATEAKTKASEKKAEKKGKKDGGSKKSGKKKGKKRSSDDRPKREAKQGKKKSSERGRSRRDGRRKGDALPEAESGPTPENRVMLVNEIPGEECRIALLENGRLDEYFVERASSATVVGNIYKARVTNIEPAIQAAFVDFGLGESGFLHVSDLHPKYFPGSDMVEQVGKKIPRKQRPPIQDALTKGQEILVQVLKQGIGTKGPTVTSYLSIPGRLMVMMPDMDRIGVSRKVADDSQRKKMRTILDSLDLPDNFGFIVRTAGFEASKLELKRDVAYLKRLWDQMDRRIQNTGAPCLLYAESDILIRTIRDVLDASIKTIVTDHPEAFERTSNFLKVSGVSNPPDIRYYDRNLPLFSAFGAEKQIASLHLKEVPLASGGALVIEQTEALVAIDVNSGRSRSAKDSETNAYETNKEAVDEICRQLRLRDLGGLIVNDLIDMRHQKHREEIERRIMRNFKRDRAKSTVLPISEFGIVEMTRQRMRPNTKKANFELCPTCEGTGEAPRPDSVAADALRRAAVVLENENVRRIELVCSRKISTILTGEKKKEIQRFEERSNRKIDIQISEKIVDKRVDIYAYDETGADVEVTRNLSYKVPKISDLPMAVDPDDPRNQKKPGKRRRRRGRGKTAPADATAIALAGGFDIDEEIEETESTAEATNAEETGKKKRRRRRGRGRGKAVREAAQREQDAKSIRIYALAKELNTTSKEILERCRAAEGYDDLKNHMSSLEGEPLLLVRSWFAPPEPEATEPDGDIDPKVEESTSGGTGDEESRPRRKRRRRRGRRGRRNEGDQSSEDTGQETASADASEPEGSRASTTEEDTTSESSSDRDEPADGEDRPRKRRRRRRGRRRRKSEGEQEEAAGSENQGDSPDPPRDSDASAADDGEAPKDDSKPRRRRRRSRKDEDGGDQSDSDGRSTASPSDAESPAQLGNAEPEVKPATASKPKRRSLYGGRMRRVNGVNQNPGE